MVKFIHLSDLHIHGAMSKPDNQSAKKIVDFIVKRYETAKELERPIILLTGDIVDDGKEEQYQQAKKILRPLIKKGFKVLVCPGNHDYGHYGIDYDVDAKERFQKFILYDLLKRKGVAKTGVVLPDLYPMKTQVDDVVFIGLDSMAGNEGEILQLARGNVGERQRNALSKILRETKPDEKVVVYFHHHPFYRNLIKRVTLELEDAKEVMAILSSRANFVCFGHKHVSECWPSVGQIDWILASGKSTERNEQYKFEFREVRIAGDDNEVSKVTFKRD